MRKYYFILLFLVISQPKLETPFNGIFASGGISYNNNKMKGSRNVIPSPATAAKEEFENKSAKSPGLYLSISINQLVRNIIIFGLEGFLSFTTKNSYTFDKSKLKINDKKPSIGIGIRFGVLTDGKSILYLEPIIKTSGVRVKTSETTLNPMDTIKKNSMEFGVKLGIILASTKIIYIDIFSIITNKNFHSKSDTKPGVHKKGITIGAICSIRLTRL